MQAAVVFNATGHAFVADLAGGVQAFAPDGKRLWQVTLEGGISATPAVSADDASLFVGTHHGRVYGLESASGAVRWRREIPSKSDPRILSDLLSLPRAGLVVGSSWGGQFHALDGQTGQEKFRWDAGLSPRSAAASDREESIYCLRARSGQGVEFVRVDEGGQERVLLREPEDPRGARRALVAAGPVLDEDRAVAYLVLNRIQGAQLLAWSLKDGAERWRRPLPASVQATPAILPEGEVVVADLAGSVQSVSAEGVPGFRYVTGSEYVLAGGVGQADGTFWVADPAGVVHTVDGSGSGAAFFEAPRSIQARLSFDPKGRLHVPCGDHAVYVLAGNP